MGRTEGQGSKMGRTEITTIQEIELEQLKVLLEIKKCEARLFEIIIEEMKNKDTSSFIRNICSIRNDVFISDKEGRRRIVPLLMDGWEYPLLSDSV